MHSNDIEVIYEKHHLLTSKGKGAACALTGKVALLLFFVNDSQAKWTPAAQKKFSKTHTSAMEATIEAAKKYAVSLTIDTITEEVTVPFICNLDFKAKNTEDWQKYIMERYNRKVFRGYKYHFKEVLGYDQIAIAFVFHRPFRAHANSDARQFSAGSIECSILGSSNSERTIMHELFHQFGAADIYPFEYCMESVKSLRYSSIMAIRGNAHVDSLTAYLIGWTDEIDDKAVALLEATKHLKLKDIISYKERT